METGSVISLIEITRETGQATTTPWNGESGEIRRHVG